jgi:7-cyano-7-deazaguanine synthase
MKPKCVVLLSSGLDSAVNLAMAMEAYEVALCLTFDYGQRAATKELQKSQELCAHFNVPHRVISIPWVKDLGQSSLTDTQKEIPTGSNVSINSLEVSEKTAKSVWVPNRNGLFLNIAAGFAESLGAAYIIPGFNKEEAVTFADNSQAFMEATDKALSFSTRNQVLVKCFTVGMDKTEIVKQALQLKFPLQKIWPCYFAGDKWCGQCESCQRFYNALKKNNLNPEELAQ